MKLQVKLKYSKAPLIIENVKWLAISKKENRLWILEKGYKESYYINIDDIIGLSVYDLSKGGDK